MSQMSLTFLQRQRERERETETERQRQRAQSNRKFRFMKGKSALTCYSLALTVHVGHWTS